jgi:predicted transcriptional regulator
MSSGYSFRKSVTFLLKSIGLTQVDIAARAECSRPYVVMVLAGVRTSKAVESAITKALGFNPWTVR